MQTSGREAVDLRGRVALVTGGARGQGRSHARTLARAGATVVVADVAAPETTAGYPLASKADLDETVEVIRAEGGTAEGVVCDVRTAEAVARTVEGVLERHGRIDVLVANAGICAFGPVDILTDE